MSDLSFLSGFDASQIEDTFELIPPGDYKVTITDSEMKMNSKGTGEFLKVSLTISDDGYTGRMLFDNFNLVHVNDKAVEIAQKQFAGLCKAAGVLAPSDSSELHDIEIIAVVDIEGDYNRVKRYKAIEKKGNLAGKTAAAPAPAPKPAPKKKRSIKAKKTTDIPGLTPDTGQDPDDDISDVPF